MPITDYSTSLMDARNQKDAELAVPCNMLKVSCHLPCAVIAQKDLDICVGILSWRIDLDEPKLSTSFHTKRQTRTQESVAHCLPLKMRLDGRWDRDGPQRRAPQQAPVCHSFDWSQKGLQPVETARNRRCRLTL